MRTPQGDYFRDPRPAHRMSLGAGVGATVSGHEREATHTGSHGQRACDRESESGLRRVSGPQAKIEFSSSQIIKPMFRSLLRSQAISQLDQSV